MGDDRVYGYAWVIRGVTTRDRESYVTVGAFEFSPAFLRDAARRLTNEVTMGNTPFAAQPNENGDTFVVFAPDTAEHGTLLSPQASSNATQPNTTFAAATCAEQKQTASFLASNGALLPIGGTCP